MPGADDDLRAEVRVAAGRRAGGVEHRGGLARDERLGRDAVDVEVVDDGDVPGAQPLGQRLGPGVDAGRAGGPGDVRQRGALAQDRSHRPSSSHGRGLQELSGMHARGLGVLPGEHPRELADPVRRRPPGARRTRSRCRRRRPDPLVTTRWVSANAATCARWVTTSTWAPTARAARRRPTSTAALPPTPASTSSKTKVGGPVRAGLGRGGERDLDGEHDAGQLAAGRALAERPGRRAGVRHEQHLDDVARPTGRARAPRRPRRRAGHRPWRGPSSSAVTAAARASPARRRPAVSRSARPLEVGGEPAPAGGRAPRAARRRRRARAGAGRRCRTRRAPRRRRRRSCGSGWSAARGAPGPPRAGAGRPAGPGGSPDSSVETSASR